MVTMIDQVLCNLLRSLNGFLLSVLSVNLMFLASLPKSKSVALKHFYC